MVWGETLEERQRKPTDVRPQKKESPRDLRPTLKVIHDKKVGASRGRVYGPRAEKRKITQKKNFEGRAK